MWPAPTEWVTSHEWLLALITIQSKVNPEKVISRKWHLGSSWASVKNSSNHINCIFNEYYANHCANFTHYFSYGEAQNKWSCSLNDGCELHINYGCEIHNLIVALTHATNLYIWLHVTNAFQGSFHAVHTMQFIPNAYLPVLHVHV